MSAQVPEAGAAHTLADQLGLMQKIHAVELARLKLRQQHDMQDVELAFEADQFCGGHPARPVTQGAGHDD